VNSEEGHGAEFWFSIPLKEPLTDSHDNGVTFSGKIYLALSDTSKLKWFQQFFQGLNLSFEVVDSGATFEQHGLLVTDHIPGSNCDHLWWLGPDYELTVSHGVMITEPFRREMLLHRLQGYGMDLQSDSNEVKAVESEHLLLVEDNLTNQLVVRKTLEKMGYFVDVANNGQEGLDAYGEKNYAGIIMDIQMPIMDGIEATRRIRKQAGRYVPIIALTANAQDDIEEACFAAGMDAFLTKPVNRVELQGTLESVIGTQASHQQ
jgi:CheY-like chemotaxis protein